MTDLHVGVDPRSAAEIVEFDEATRTWLLSTPATSYALRVTQDAVWHVYWGPRLTLAQAAAVPVRSGGRDEVFGEELPGEGGERYAGAGLRVSFADGTEATEWRVVDQLVEDVTIDRPGGGHSGRVVDDGVDEYRVDGGHLAVRLVDRHYPVELELHYRAYTDTDVIERWTVLRNTGGTEPVTLRRVDSAGWTLPGRDDYRLSHVAGEWAAEFTPCRTPVPVAETTLTSRRGIARHQGNPWFMIDAGDATEERGEVWSGALAWSGTYQITVRRTLGGRVAVTGGAGHDGLRWHLAAGEEWRTPVFAGLFAADGFGGTSRRWHAYARRHVLAHPDEIRPVLYNSWEGTWFDVNEDNQRRLAGLAAEMGVELFVMDDGWFGGRTSDHAGLGDWWANPDRFPDGLSPLITEVHQLGMRFGIWVEPEMVNPDSELYRAHPDWVLHMPHRTRTELRNQLVLNFARPDVAAWAYEWLDRLLSEHEIDFVKWDMNRAFTEAGWPDSPDAHRLWFEHTRRVYEVLDRLRANHPGVRVESCASGGGRADHGILRRTDQVWTSDNTDPVDRIAIQHGYTQVYPASTMGAWASQNPNPLTRREVPLRFRFHVAMAGVLGVSGSLPDWSDQERREAAELILRYKEVRHVVQHGELYRLTPPEGTTVVQYLGAGANEAVVLAWRPLWRYGRPEHPVRLAGLDPSGRYRDRLTGAEYDGAVLLHHGLDLVLPAGDHASVLVHLVRLS